MKEAWKKQCAFSLLELLIAVSVFVAVSLGAAMELSTLLEQGKLKREARGLVEAIGSLILAAEQHESVVTLELREDSYRAFLKDRPAVILYSHALKAPLRLAGLNRPLYLHENGTSTPATLTLIGEKQLCLIKISLRGRTTLLC